MAKIKELLAGREKLAKYDELTEWKTNFTHEGIYLGLPYMDFGNEQRARDIVENINNGNSKI